MEKTMYKILSWGHSITPVIVIKETDNFITIKGSDRKHGKITAYKSFFNSHEDAYSAIEKRILSEIRRGTSIANDASEELFDLINEYKK